MIGIKVKHCRILPWRIVGVSHPIRQRRLADGRVVVGDQRQPCPVDRCRGWLEQCR